MNWKNIKINILGREISTDNITYEDIEKVNHNFTIEVEDRAEFIEALKTTSISLNYGKGEFPVSISKPDNVEISEDLLIFLCGVSRSEWNKKASNE